MGTSLRCVLSRFPDCQIDAVDIDETVIDVAVNYFSSPSRSEVHYRIGDGVSFLDQTDAVYDLIFVDAYMRNQIYSACLEPAFADLLYARLSSRGIAACNLITTVPPHGRTKQFVEAASRHFSAVQLLPVGVPWSEQNALGVFARETDGLSAWPEAIRRSDQLGWLQRMSWPGRIMSVPCGVGP